MKDGKPINGKFQDMFDLDQILVSNVDRIEIIKGPAARIYGQNAFNGAINIVTKSAWKANKKEAVIFLNNISGGSYGNFKYSLYSNISINNYRGFINS